MRKRSRVLGGVIGCLAVLVTAACGSDDDGGSEPSSDGGIDGQQGVYVNYGGQTMETVEATWFKSFEEETGAKLVGDSPSDLAKLRVMVESDNVTWDLIDIDGGSGATGCAEGLFMTRDELNVDVSAFDPKYLSDDCGVPIYNTTTALVYNKEKYGDNPPTSITDFLDTENFPGKRMTFNYAVWALENFELAAGVAPEDLYPYDYDVVKEAYNSIKDDVVLVDTLAQMSDSIAAGDFDMCFCITGRLAISPGISPEKVGVVWDHAWVANDMLYAVKGSKVPDLQAEFLNYVALPSTQNEFAEVQPYGPMTNGEPPEVPEAFEYWMPEYNEDQTNGLSYIDYGYLSEEGIADEANAMWTEIAAG